MRRRWSIDDIRSGLAVHAARLGRMPTTTEMRACGENALAVRASRSVGGIRGWAAGMGLELSGSETHVGQEHERRLAAWLTERGFTVTQQTTKAPFDLLVDGVRVDVKASTFHVYRGSRGYAFALRPARKKAPGCDLYALCCLDDSGEVVSRYFIPASEATMQQATVTPSGQRWTKYKDALDELRALVKQEPAMWDDYFPDEDDRAREDAANDDPEPAEGMGCAGSAAYEGPCGADDCPTCHPGSDAAADQVQANDETEDDDGV